MDDVNKFAKNKKEQKILTQTIRISNQDIGIWNRKMCHAYN